MFESPHLTEQFVTNCLDATSCCDADVADPREEPQHQQNPILRLDKIMRERRESEDFTARTSTITHHLGCVTNSRLFLPTELLDDEPSRKPNLRPRRVLSLPPRLPSENSLYGKDKVITVTRSHKTKSLSHDHRSGGSLFPTSWDDAPDFVLTNPAANDDDALNIEVIGEESHRCFRLLPRTVEANLEEEAPRFLNNLNEIMEPGRAEE